MADNSRDMYFNFYGRDRGAGRQFDKLGNAADKTRGKLDGSQKTMGKFGERAKSVGILAAKGFAVAGVAAAGLAVKAVKSFAEFDEAMSHVKAATHETAANMDLLRKAALQAGKDTVYSATEAAGAIEELSKAGVQTKDILGGGLAGALSLASAGSLEVGEAAEIAATALVQFRLSGEKVPHVADLLAAGAGKAQGSVHDLGFALKMGGLVASQFGISIEDTVGTMAAFASAGLIGSDAGTSFKTMLLRLANPSDKAAGEMKDLGIAAYDAKGNFVGLPGLADQLQKKLKNLTPAQRDSAMATIFGSDALRGANVLYQQGKKGIEEWIKKVNDQGYAAETAATKLDNLKGDVEKLGGSIETMFIEAGGAGNIFARKIVQFLTAAVDSVNNAVPKAKKAFEEFRAGLLGKDVTTKDARGRIEVIPYIPKSAREKIGATVRRAFTGGVDGFIDSLDDLIKRLNKWLRKQDWVKVGETIGTKTAEALEGSAKVAAAVTTALVMIATKVDFNQVATGLLIGLVTSFAKGIYGSLRTFGKEVGPKIDKAIVDAFKNPEKGSALHTAYALGEAIIDGIVKGITTAAKSKFAPGLESFRKFIGWVKDLFGVKSPSTVFAGIGRNVVQGFIDGFTSKVPNALSAGGSLISKIRGKFNGARSWLVNPGKRVVDGLINGIKNRLPSLNKTVSSAVSRFVGIFGRIKNTRGSAAYVVNSVLGRLISKFNSVSKALGGKGIGVPKFRYGGYTGGVRPEKGGGSNAAALASGGDVRGPGTGTSDSILARLSNGEFVVNAKQTARNRDLLEAINKGAPGFASGGLIGGDMNMRAFTDPKGYLKGMQRPILSTFLPRLGGSPWGAMLKQIPRKVAEYSVTKIEKIFKTLGFGAGNIGAAIAFAKSQSGKPYQWGGVGNPSWDCSGFMSGITNVLQGRNPRSRLFTTHSFAGGRGVAGFKSGAKSVFQVGVNPGSHMAGTLYAGRNAYNVESGGSANVRFGSGALGAGDFRYRLGLTRFGSPNRGKAGLEGAFAANGGSFNSGQFAMVGEEGRELIRFKKPGTVFNNKDTERIVSASRSGGGAPITVYVTASPLSTPADTGRAVYKALLALQQKNGGAPLNLKTVG